MKNFYTLILLLFISITAQAQQPGVIDTNVYRINENDVKHFIAAHKSMNLTKDDFEWIKNHPYEGNQNAELYQRIRKSILAAGFKDYAEYAKVSQRVVMVYSFGDNSRFNEEQEKQMEEALSNPGIPEQYKTLMRQQLESLKRQNPTPAETQSVTPHRKELEEIFAKFKDEG